MPKLKIPEPVTEKYKIWDTENSAWFRPVYPRNKETRTREIFFSQSGEMFLYESEQIDGPFTMTHIIPGENARFIPCLYTGLKDDKDIKVYHNDTILCNGSTGVVIMNMGCWMIKWDDTTEENISFLGFIGSKMRPFEVTGNILEIEKQQ